MIASKQQIVVNFILYLVCVFDSFLICKTTFANYISLGNEPTGVLKSLSSSFFSLYCFDEKNEQIEGAHVHSLHSFFTPSFSALSSQAINI